MSRNRSALYWHSFFLAVTTSFTETNTVMPALLLEAGGTERTVGFLTATMIGLPLVSQLLFASYLHSRERKKPYLLFGVNLRVVALSAAAAGIALIGTDRAIIPVVFATMALFALSGAFAGVSYTEIVGRVITLELRRTFFVRRQITSAIGLLVSAVATRLFLGATVFPRGYVLLFAMAAAFLLTASLGFWAIDEPHADAAPDSDDEPSPRGKARGGRRLRDALALVPRILREDRNMRSLILAVNLGALGFTAIPLITALGHRSYDLTPAVVGAFVIVQVAGMLVANVIWSRLIRRGGFRFVLFAELTLIAVLFPAALLVARFAPIVAFGALYALVGAIISAHRLGVDAILVQISPDHSRALYAGVFGAANLAAALMPLLTGILVRSLGFVAVFVAAAAFALFAILPARGLECGEWYRDS